MPKQRKVSYENLQAYTSTVPPEKTIAHIEMLLAQIGANSISKNYRAGLSTPVGISFSINLGEKVFFFKIPIMLENALKVLMEQEQAKRKRRMDKDTIAKIEAQAIRTAWRIVYDWIYSQMSMIRLQQAESMQMFFAYLVDQKTDKTLYEQVSSNNFKLLESK